MRLATPMLMLSLASLNSCSPEQIDSFCQVYNKVIIQKGTKIVAPPDVKKRLLANELTYRKVCPQQGA